jgi:catechol 2,3-dioxygenase-like lactoylglutathione lyase family enzyme
MTLAKAVGVGGVFLKARDPEALAAWYAAHLGIPAQDGGSLAFDGPESTGMTVFAHFPQETSYFGGGEQQFMVNFRVDDLDELLAELAAKGGQGGSQARGLCLRPVRMDLGPGGEPGGALAAAVRLRNQGCWTL